MYNGKYVYMMINPHNWGGYGDVYFADKKIRMSDLKKDYYQEIQTMSYSGSEYGVKNVCANTIELSEIKYKYEADFSMYDDSYIYNMCTMKSDIHTLAFEESVDNALRLNLSKDVDVYIVFPDWECQYIELYLEDKKIAIFNSDKKECSRYISAFVYEVEKNKITLSDRYNVKTQLFN